MLRRIILKDFAIVDNLDLDFYEGFSTLTGETGAGKSILIEAIQLVLGERLNFDCVKEGTKLSDICVEFDIPENKKENLIEAGFLSKNDESLLLRRTIDSQGRSRTWINGIPTTLGFVRSLSKDLVDIYGQHAWHSLTYPDGIRNLLDNFANLQTKKLKQIWQSWKKSSKILEEAKLNQENLRAEFERLNWQINEVEKLNPQIDEWQELNQNHTRLSNANSLLEVATEVSSLIENEEIGIKNQLNKSLILLKAKENLELEFNLLSESLNNVLNLINDISRDLNNYLNELNLEPENLNNLEKIDKKLSLWINLSQRYKCEPKKLPNLLKSWKKEINSLENNFDLEFLIENEKKLYQKYLKTAQIFSEKRKKIAKKLAKEVTASMQEIGIKEGYFKIQLNKLEIPQAHGFDEIKFLVTTNKNLPARPINKIASGGELSRLSLVILVVTNKNSKINKSQALIFDEIDTGTGGFTAAIIGKFLQTLGQNKQVLAITHLPQVASYSKNHYIVNKTQNPFVKSTVFLANQKEREQELARMLGGEKISEITLSNAKELLKNAKLNNN